MEGPRKGSGQIGWLSTDDGAWVANEPDGASSWLPCNDHPSDKATLTMSIDVPRRLKGISNGELVDVSNRGKRRTWVWRAEQPIATYLITAAIGRYRLDTDPIAGLASWLAVDSRLPRRASRDVLEHEPEARGAIESKISPYPFDSTGAIIDRGPPHVYYALETQNRPIYNANVRGEFTPPIHIVVAHETAHQWFGNSVTPDSWKDIWLNEGFASWMERFWEQQMFPNAKEDPLERTFDFYYRVAPKRMNQAEKRAYWNPPPGRVTKRKQLFDSAIYQRGMMTLQALSGEIGEDTLLEIFGRWADEHRYGNATTRDFIELAEEVSGRDLDHFFRVWLFERGKPRNWSESSVGARVPAARSGAWRKFEPLSLDGLGVDPSHVG